MEMQVQHSLEQYGYLNLPVDPKIDLVSEIKRLKKEKNALILGHYYITGDLQDISDYTGDSLGLSQQAQDTQADIIVFLGVHFMAETAKILNPNKKVLIPDLKAGCSLAESAPADKFAAFKAAHPGHQVISYINCSAEIKALSDVICTSSNAQLIVDSFPEDQKLIFAPDKNLGNYINSVTGRNMILWDGACMVHEKYSLEKILDLKARYPEADFIAHPECEKPVLIAADFVGSTTALLKYSQKSAKQKFIVATESGILHQMQKDSPDKVFIPAPAIDSTCGCNDCSFMKLNTMEKLYLCLEFEQPELKMDPELMQKAKAPLLKMLEISRKLKN
ncbi:MAG: quinolinate synthase NadA [Cyclobacteriaceae bacterium]|nr:quinolinate synthase NadA [Cyclobacteriaceae bacterium]